MVEQRINSEAGGIIGDGCSEVYIKCYVKPMKDPLGVSPSKGNQGAKGRTIKKSDWGGGGLGGGNFQLARIFFFAPCLCRNFLQVKPSARIFFQKKLCFSFEQ